MTAQTPDTVDTGLLAEAAAQAAAVLPSVNPLTPAGPQPGNEHVAAAFRSAVVARVTGGSGSLCVLVGDELTEALASSPTPNLSMAAAVQPAIDAAAAALGCSVGAGVEVDTAALDAELGGPYSVVPLIGQGFAAALGATDDALLPGGTTPDPAPVEATAAAVPHLQPSAVTHEPLSPPTGVPTRSPGAPAPGPSPARGIEMLHGVDMELTVELGRTRMAVRDLLALAPGDVLELDRAAGSPADLLVNGRLIARGEVVVVDEDFGLRITQILDSNAG